MFTTIKFKENGIAVMTIDRQEALNALNAEVISDIEEIIGEVENDPKIRALIITGAGRSFVAGADIGAQSVLDVEGGRIWGTMFFLFMTFASFSTIIAVFENIMSFCMDMFGWDRKKAALVNCVIILIASMPCVLGYNVWRDLHLIGGRDVLDSEDFIVSNLLLPGGSLIYLLFCVTKWGWGFDNYLEEANTGKGLKIAKGLKPYFQFVLPVLILFILIQGLI